MTRQSPTGYRFVASVSGGEGKVTSENESVTGKGEECRGSEDG